MTKSIIFLDIDGVLNTMRTQMAFESIPLNQGWDITACQMIQRLCQKHNIQIVISSDWRTKETLDIYLYTYGLLQYLHTDNRITTKDETRDMRSEGIAEWISEHPEIENYFIIDDSKESKFTAEQQKHLVQTKFLNGFMYEHYQQIEKHFG